MVCFEDRGIHSCRILDFFDSLALDIVYVVKNVHPIRLEVVDIYNEAEAPGWNNNQNLDIRVDNVTNADNIYDRIIKAIKMKNLVVSDSILVVNPFVYD